MKVLITGRAGSGKTAVFTELKRRGYTVYDADHVKGLCSWQNRTTGQPATVNAHAFVNLDQYHWAINDTAFRDFVRDRSDFFICVGAAHELEYTELFDHSFVLNVSPSIHLERLLTRPDNDYGKDPQMARKIVELQADLMQEALQKGFIPLDADEPIEQVVNEILAESYGSQ